jgi:hypothetical protein
VFAVSLYERIAVTPLHTAAGSGNRDETYERKARGDDAAAHCEAGGSVQFVTEALTKSDVVPDRHQDKGGGFAER